MEKNLLACCLLVCLLLSACGGNSDADGWQQHGPPQCGASAACR